MLSQYKIGPIERKNPSFFSNDRIQNNPAVALAKALYSNFVLEREIGGCFLDIQEMILQPRNVQ
jgi:hypothetical protein